LQQENTALQLRAIAQQNVVRAPGQANGREGMAAAHSLTVLQYTSTRKHDIHLPSQVPRRYLCVHKAVSILWLLETTIPNVMAMATAMTADRCPHTQQRIDRRVS
jgi:hypothetical protein